jgi:hypothetical protein
MKKIINLSLISLTIALATSTSYAFDFSDIKGIFFKESKDKKETVIEVMSTPSASNSVATSAMLRTMPISASTTNQKSTSSKEKDLVDSEIKKDDKCEVKKSKLNIKKDALIKANQSQKDDTNKIIENLETIAGSSYEDDIKIINEKVEELKKEVSDVTAKQNEMITLIASTTEMNCNSKVFEKNLLKIKKLADEKKVQLSEVKDFLNKDIKDTLKQIKD